MKVLRARSREASTPGEGSMLSGRPRSLETSPDPAILTRYNYFPVFTCSPSNDDLEMVTKSMMRSMQSRGPDPRIKAYDPAYSSCAHSSYGYSESASGTPIVDARGILCLTERTPSVSLPESTGSIVGTPILTWPTLR